MIFKSRCNSHTIILTLYVQFSYYFHIYTKLSNYYDHLTLKCFHHSTKELLTQQDGLRFLLKFVCVSKLFIWSFNAPAPMENILYKDEDIPPTFLHIFGRTQRDIYISNKEYFHSSYPSEELCFHPPLLKYNLHIIKFTNLNVWFNEF